MFTFCLDVEILGNCCVCSFPNVFRKFLVFAFNTHSFHFFMLTSEWSQPSLGFCQQTFRTDTEGWNSACEIQSSEVSAAESHQKKLHIVVDPSRLRSHKHTMFSHAGRDAAERECGIAWGSGAGGWQLFALFVFDLSRPRRMQRLFSVYNKGSVLPNETNRHSSKGGA